MRPKAAIYSKLPNELIELGTKLLPFPILREPCGPRLCYACGGRTQRCSRCALLIWVCPKAQLTIKALVIIIYQVFFEEQNRHNSVFKNLKNMIFGSSQAEEFPKYEVPMSLIWNQLPMCGLLPTELAQQVKDDDFLLGYVFGMADMANYQFNPSSHDQSQALPYIQKVFSEALGSMGDELMHQALGAQSSPLFQKGRQIGADELGDWIKSSGQKVPFSLCRQLGGSTKSDD